MNGLQGTLDAYLVEGATVAKNEALDAVEATASAWDARVVFAAIAAIAPGQPVSTNDLREQLDEAGVPVTPRPALMRAACRDGLLEPFMIFIAGQKVQAAIPSTGASARGAYVKLYRRTTSEWAPTPIAAVA